MHTLIMFYAQMCIFLLSYFTRKSRMDLSDDSETWNIDAIMMKYIYDLYNDRSIDSHLYVLAMEIWNIIKPIGCATMILRSDIYVQQK